MREIRTLIMALAFLLLTSLPALAWEDRSPTKFLEDAKVSYPLVKKGVGIRINTRLIFNDREQNSAALDAFWKAVGYFSNNGWAKGETLTNAGEINFDFDPRMKGYVINARISIGQDVCLPDKFHSFKTNFDDWERRLFNKTEECVERFLRH